MRLRYVTCSVTDCLHQEVIVFRKFYDHFVQCIHHFVFLVVNDVFVLIGRFNVYFAVQLLCHDQTLETFFTGFLDGGCIYFCE